MGHHRRSATNAASVLLATVAVAFGGASTSLAATPVREGAGSGGVRASSIDVAAFAASGPDSPSTAWNRSAGYARRASSQKKPPGVPAEYVITPSGFFHPSCVVELASDEVLGSDLVIRGLDGSRRDSVAPCAYPRYDFRGRPLSATLASTESAPVFGPGASTESAPRLFEPKVPAAQVWDGYTTYYHYEGTPWAAYQSALWTVPPYPATVGPDEVIFLWPGILVTNAGLLQPVLGFENGLWNIASWDCCVTGNAEHTAGIQVNPGDVIQGTTQGNNCDTSTGTCQNWTVTTTDTTCGQTQVLNTASPPGLPQSTYPAVMELYSVTSCDMLPANGEETFSSGSPAGSVGERGEEPHGTALVT